MISCNQLRKYVIQPVLCRMHIYTPIFEEILVSTCAQESRGGYYIHQINGPAIGLFQMETPTALTVWNEYKVFQTIVEQKKYDNANFVEPSPLMKTRIESSNRDLVISGASYYFPTNNMMAFSSANFEEMAGNLYFATTMATLNYYLRSEKFLELKDKDLKSLWDVYKPFWNTMEGKATFDEFERNYLEFIKT